MSENNSMFNDNRSRSPSPNHTRTVSNLNNPTAMNEGYFPASLNPLDNINRISEEKHSDEYKSDEYKSEEESFPEMEDLIGPILYER